MAEGGRPPPPRAGAALPYWWDDGEAADPRDPRHQPPLMRPERAVSTRSSWSTRMMPRYALDIRFEDLVNPYNRFTLLMLPQDDLLEWLANRGLIEQNLTCPTCDRQSTLNQRGRCIDGWSWRCPNRHETTIRLNSFFSRSHLYIPDVLLFVFCYAERMSLAQCAQACGMGYRRTAVDWASFIRDLFVQFVHELLQIEQLAGEIEIDESLFGHKVKHHRGNPRRGRKIWVVGLVERYTNKLLLFPVDDRRAGTLEAIVSRFVRPGSRLYTDGWAGYNGLSGLGYEHFTAVHKHAFKVVYVNQQTGERVVAHTNRIEGAWKHAKAHFRRMNGSSFGNFEGHLCEIIWRNRTQGNPIPPLLQLITQIYTIDAFPRLNAPFPVFPTWRHMRDAEAVMEDVRNENRVPRIYRVDSSSDDDDNVPGDLSSDDGDDDPPGDGDNPGGGGREVGGDTPDDPADDPGEDHPNPRERNPPDSRLNPEPSTMVDAATHLPLNLQEEDRQDLHNADKNGGADLSAYNGRQPQAPSLGGARSSLSSSCGRAGTSSNKTSSSSHATSKAGASVGTSGYSSALPSLSRSSSKELSLRNTKLPPIFEAPLLHGLQETLPSALLDRALSTDSGPSRDSSSHASMDSGSDSTPEDRHSPLEEDKVQPVIVDSEGEREGQERVQREAGLVLYGTPSRASDSSLELTPLPPPPEERREMVMGLSVNKPTRIKGAGICPPGFYPVDSSLVKTKKNDSIEKANVSSPPPSDTKKSRRNRRFLSPDGLVSVPPQPPVLHLIQRKPTPRQLFVRKDENVDLLETQVQVVSLDDVLPTSAVEGASGPALSAPSPPVSPLPTSVPSPPVSSPGTCPTGTTSHDNPKQANPGPLSRPSYMQVTASPTWTHDRRSHPTTQVSRRASAQMSQVQATGFLSPAGGRSAVTFSSTSSRMSIQAPHLVLSSDEEQFIPPSSSRSSEPGRTPVSSASRMLVPALSLGENEYLLQEGRHFHMPSVGATPFTACTSPRPATPRPPTRGPRHMAMGGSTRPAPVVHRGKVQAKGSGRGRCLSHLEGGYTRPVARPLHETALSGTTGVVRTGGLPPAAFLRPPVAKKPKKAPSRPVAHGQHTARMPTVEPQARYKTQAFVLSRHVAPTSTRSPLLTAHGLPAEDPPRSTLFVPRSRASGQAASSSNGVLHRQEESAADISHITNIKQDQPAAQRASHSGPSAGTSHRTRRCVRSITAVIPPVRRARHAHPEAGTGRGERGAPTRSRQPNRLRRQHAARPAGRLGLQGRASQTGANEDPITVSSGDDFY